MSPSITATVRAQLAAIEEQIDALHRIEEQIISEAAPTFAHLPERMTKLYGNSRYVMVYADGSLPEYVYPLTQRPAALKAARRPGRYVWDTRERVVLNGKDEIVFRQEPLPSQGAD